MAQKVLLQCLQSVHCRVPAGKNRNNVSQSEDPAGKIRGKASRELSHLLCNRQKTVKHTIKSSSYSFYCFIELAGAHQEAKYTSGDTYLCLLFIGGLNYTFNHDTIVLIRATTRYLQSAPISFRGQRSI